MSHSILIVDDSATTRAFVKRAVGMCDLPVDRIEEAVDGHAALELLERAPVDVVFADLNMPQMNGLELTRRMLASERLRHIPVIVISAEPKGGRLEDLLKLGVKGYLKKPFTPEAVRQAITVVMGGVHA